MDVTTFRVTSQLVKDTQRTKSSSRRTHHRRLAADNCIGGMNLPLVLTAAFADAETPLDGWNRNWTGEAKDQIAV